MVRFILAVSMVCAVQTAKAQETYGFIQAEAAAEHATEITPALDALLGHHFGDSGWGMSGFFQVTKGWGQAYGGPTYAPAPWVELGLNIGMQQLSADDLGLRYATVVWMGKEMLEFLGIVEFDNLAFQGDQSGVWYDLTATVAPTDWLKVGFKARRSAGLGFYIDGKIPETPLELWLAWTPLDPEQVDGLLHLSRFVFAARLNL